MKDLSHYLAEPRTVHDDERARRLATEQAISQLREWWSPVKAQLPNWSYARFGNAPWSAQVAPVLIAAARGWDVMGGANLIACGPTGAGKSSALVARLRQLFADLMGGIAKDPKLPRLPSVRWLTEETLMRDAYRWDSDESAAVWAKDQARYHVYVVDEVGFVGGERAPTGKTPALQAVVDARYVAGKGTTITTGLTPAQFVGGVDGSPRYGLATWRRLTERATVVNLHA